MSARSLAIAGTCLALLAAAPRARAGAHPTRSGETGFVEVPSAEVVGAAGSVLGMEVRLDRISGDSTRFGPFPVYGVAGIAERLELGFSIRQWGAAGDELPQRTTILGAAKLKIASATPSSPALAADVVVDQLNFRPVVASRLVASTELLTIRLGAFAGGEFGPGGGRKSGATAGGALAVALDDRTEGIAEATWGPRGTNLGLASRWRVRPNASVQLGLNYLPGSEGFRVSLGLAFTPRRRPLPPRAGAVPLPVAPQQLPAEAAFRDDRPRFRLRLHEGGAASQGQGRRLQHGPLELASLTRVGPAAPGAKATVPSLEELAETQLREQEALADARERRVRSTSEQLDARENAALARGKQLDARETELGARERQLEERERRTAAAGAPTQQQRQLESLEAQLASRERELGAEERSMGVALDAAEGREREAASREDAERRELTRLTASLAGAATRPLVLEIRKQVLGGRNRRLSALEARLVARSERVDALERRQRLREERLDVSSRRLDTRAERLDLLERRAAEPRPVTPARSKDRPAFVMVVKSPTAILKEGATAAPAPAPGTPLHPGAAVEKAVAAATIVAFATPASELAELDRETVESIARLAAREQCELLIWARAKDPSLMGEAQRRISELRARVVAVGPVPEGRVVTRITTRPGATGVDVVVSALRETKASAAAPPPAGPTLLSGESGKRQIREAVVAAQPAIEACFGAMLSERPVQRTEAALTLTISAGGKVLRVAASGTELAGDDLAACLTGAAGAWSFPTSDAEYKVEVPISVVQGGAR